MSTINLQAKTAVYTGKTINIDDAQVSGSSGDITYAYYSDAACKKKVTAHKNAGVYYVKATVAADTKYKSATSKAVKLTIKKAANPLTVKTKTPTAILLGRTTARIIPTFPMKSSQTSGRSPHPG